MDQIAVQSLLKLNPGLQQLLKERKRLPIPNDIEGIRNMVQPMEAALIASPAPEGVEEIVENIPVRDGTMIQARVHPPTKSSMSPLVVHFHSGGYCIGSSAFTIPLCRDLVRRFNAVCVSIDYRLAPEHIFPTAVNDCWDALQWLARHASELHADASKGFIVGGESSGANAAIVCTHLARNQNLSPPLTGQFLSVPACLPAETVPEKYKPFFHSWEESKASSIYNHGMTAMFRSTYAPDMTSPLYGMFNDPSGHAGLPRAYFQVCGLDPVRDEGLIYVRINL